MTAVQVKGALPSGAGHGGVQFTDALSHSRVHTPEELPDSSLSRFMSTQLRQPVTPNTAQPFVTVPCKCSQLAKISATCGSHAHCYQPQRGHGQWEQRDKASGDLAGLECGSYFGDVCIILVISLEVWIILFFPHYELLLLMFWEYMSNSGTLVKLAVKMILQHKEN